MSDLEELIEEAKEHALFLEMDGDESLTSPLIFRLVAELEGGEK